jgi:DNA-binding transcriptional regulator YhcF (GntR family)
VRVLARQLAVNQNTILRVYERLTTGGLLDRRHGNGTFVAAAPSKDQLQKQSRSICRQIEALVRRAVAMGVEADGLHALIDTARLRDPRSEPPQTRNPS